MVVRILFHAINRWVGSQTVKSHGWRGVCGVALTAMVFYTSFTLAGGDSMQEEDGLVNEEQVEKILSSKESAATGEMLFNQVCVYCHGAQGIGGKARTMQCRDFKSQYLFDTISYGRKRGAFVMPSWEKSYDEQTRWELVSYVMTLKDLEKCQ